MHCAVNIPALFFRTQAGGQVAHRSRMASRTLAPNVWPRKDRGHLCSHFTRDEWTPIPWLETENHKVRGWRQPEQDGAQGGRRRCALEGGVAAGESRRAWWPRVAAHRVGPQKVLLGLHGGWRGGVAGSATGL